MSAKPIIAGKSYQVTGKGFKAVVLASNPCDAICIGIEILIALRGDV